MAIHPALNVSFDTFRGGDLRARLQVYRSVNEIRDCGAATGAATLQL